jgi:inhibitor of KinA
MDWVQIGPDAILLKFAEENGVPAFQKCSALVRELEEHPPRFLREFTPAYTTLLLELDLRGGLQLAGAAREVLAQLEKCSRKRVPPGPVKKIPVLYDGVDLDRIANLNKLTRNQVIGYHSKETYLVHFLGFAPGFPYLTGLNKKLRTPRLENPRSRVPAGSIAIGGEHTGIYSVEMPGGWNLIGRTNVKIFDLEKAIVGKEEEAFYLKQGDRVRFVPVKELPGANAPVEKRD